MVARKKSAKAVLEDLIARDSVLGKLHDGEPIFVLRGQDILAADIIRRWADIASQEGISSEKYKHAQEKIADFEAWVGRRLPD